MSLHRYDLAVIGSGPAGQKAALAAAKLGKRVALIDRENGVGGVCIHTGTIPSKALREAVLQYTQAGRRLGSSEHAGNGVGGGGGGLLLAELLSRANTVVRQEVDVIRSQMSRNQIAVIYGTASFRDPNRIVVSRGDDLVEVSAQKFLVAVGTEPARPPEVPFTPGRVIDSNELLCMDRLPRTMTIVGGGVIGTEYASILAAVGVKVTLVDQRGRLLEFVDEEIAEALQYRLRELGIRLKLGEKTQSIVAPTAADDDVQLILESGKTVRSDVLLYCIGRHGATASLDLANAGLKPDSRGRLKVNEHLQTEVEHIYAAGDVIGFPALAATAMEQGRLAAWHMFNQIAAPANPNVPYGIYTIPEVSMIGSTEAQLTEAKTPYEIGVARYREIARGQILGDPVGMLKLLFHPESRRLLGVHALGTGATELIHIGQAVMTAGLPIDYFVETVFNYPTLAECYKVAALDGINRVRRPSTARDHVEETQPLKISQAA